MEMKNVVIVDAVRSAFGRGARGTLAATRMDDVAAEVIKGLLERNANINPYDIEDMVCGNVGNNGELSGMTSNTVARVAELPPEMSTATVNRQCGSSMQALHMITRSIMTGAGEIGIAAGVERMGRGIPPRGDGDNPLTTIHPRVMALTEGQKKPDPNHDQYYSVEFPDYLLASPANPSMPQTSQNVAEAWNLSREEMDRYSVESHHKTAQADLVARLGLLVAPFVQVDQPFALESDIQQHVVAADADYVGRENTAVVHVRDGGLRVAHPLLTTDR